MFRIYVPDLCSECHLYIQAAKRGQGGPDGQDGTLQNDEKLKFDKGIDEGTTGENQGEIF